MNEKRQDFQELLDALGVKLGAGSGDYTEDRCQWLDQMSLEEIFLAMRQAEEGDESHYEEIC